MKDVVRRYITRNPKLQAGKDLKKIVSKLIHIEKKDFDREYNLWLGKYKDFLKERTYNEEGKWVYTHQRLRSAVNSINRYRQYLFTYQSNRWLKPTNNSLEGTNAGLKGYFSVHSGLRPDRKLKLVHHYLKERSKFEWGSQK
ncbi:hypothetical protein GF357_00930 [Candidatus Dojkabacteria bacterium]|nr:hypothetical protein [Candidatus Dojkabacteria bacterium]